MSLTHIITAFHDPANASCMLVSARTAPDKPRDLYSVPRDRPHIVRRNILTGVREDATQLWHHDYAPVHGQRVDEHEYYQLPPDWRWSLPAGQTLPIVEPEWLRCTLLFVWGSERVAALCDLRDGRTDVFWRAEEALHALRGEWSAITDVLLVCTAEAQDVVEEDRSRRGWREFARALPIVCPVDLFVRTTSLDRTADGTPSWYRPPFHFAPDGACVMSERRRNDMVEALVDDRRRWVNERRVVPMMFSLCELTRLPLHEVAVAQQTMLADALVETVWMAAPLDFDAPRVVHGDPTADELSHFTGANVLTAQLGLHRKPVLMPDVRSLYPSVVLEYMRDDYPLMAEVFRVMIERRSNERDPVRAASLKVTTSSRYGTLKYGRYRDTALAQRITAAGRDVQAESLRALAASSLVGLTVIAGDTDSLAISVEPGCMTASLQARLVRVLNAERRFALYKDQIDCFSCVFFISNKSWAGVRASDDVVVTRGFPQNKSVTPRFMLDAHCEWVRLVLRDAAFAQTESTRLVWIAARAVELRATQWPVADLVVWPKPTRDHPETDRGYVVLRHSRKHVPYHEHMRAGTSRLPVDVDYMVQLYFVDELERQSHLLGGCVASL